MKHSLVSLNQDNQLIQELKGQMFHTINIKQSSVQMKTVFLLH